MTARQWQPQVRIKWGCVFCLCFGLEHLGVHHRWHALTSFGLPAAARAAQRFCAYRPQDAVADGLVTDSRTMRLVPRTSA